MVKDVAVIGLPDDKWGERVHAVIVLHEGAVAEGERAARLVQGAIGRLQAATFLLVHPGGRNATQRNWKGSASHAQGKAPAVRTRSARRANEGRGRRHARRPERGVADFRADAYRICAGASLSGDAFAIGVLVGLKLLFQPAVTAVLALYFFDVPPVWSHPAVLLSALPIGSGRLRSPSFADCKPA